jgi:hypothetical protein
MRPFQRRPTSVEINLPFRLTHVDTGRCEGRAPATSSAGDSIRKTIRKPERAATVGPNA